MCNTVSQYVLKYCAGMLVVCWSECMCSKGQLASGSRLSDEPNQGPETQSGLTEMLQWWLSCIRCFAWTHCWDALALVSCTCHEVIWQRLPSSPSDEMTSTDSSAQALQRQQQDMPVTHRWILSTVTLQWNPLLITAVWVISSSTLSCHFKKQVDLFFSFMSFYTALNRLVWSEVHCFL